MQPIDFFTSRIGTSVFRTLKDEKPCPVLIVNEAWAKHLYELQKYNITYHE
jgi:hypothetical protein